MYRNVLLALVMIGVIAGCGRRDDDANAPEPASPPTTTTEPAPAEPGPGEPEPAESAPAEAPPSASAPAAPADAPVAEESPAEADACNAELVQNLVGELYTPELGEQARISAGARVERALRPGQIVTMEFRSDRLSFTLDEKGRISQVSCG